MPEGDPYFTYSLVKESQHQIYFHPQWCILLSPSFNLFLFRPFLFVVLYFIAHRIEWDWLKVWFNAIQYPFLLGIGIRLPAFVNRFAFSMAYLSYYRPLLRELGQGHVFLWGSRASWGYGHFYHGVLHDLWGRKLHHGFGDTDIHETQNNITITSDMPGVKKEKIKVSCCSDILSVSTERPPPSKLVDDIFGSMERGYGSISRSIRLPPHTDYSKISATYENGVLSISITKPEVKNGDDTEITIPIHFFVCSITRSFLICTVNHVYKGKKASIGRL